MDINWQRLKALGGAFILVTSLSGCNYEIPQETEMIDSIQSFPKSKKVLDLNPLITTKEINQQELESSACISSIDKSSDELYLVQDLYVLGLYYIHSLNQKDTNKDVSYEIVTLSDRVVVSDYDDCALCHFSGNATGESTVESMIVCSVFDEDKRGYMLFHEFYDSEGNLQYFGQFVGDFGYWNYSTQMDSDMLIEPRDVLTMPLDLSHTTYKDYDMLTLGQLRDVADQLNAASYDVGKSIVKSKSEK